MSRRRITALAVAVLATAAAGCDDSEGPPMTRLSRPRVDVGRIAMVKFPLYAPRGPVGDVWLREIAETSDTGDLLELNFTAFQVDETRVTAAFRPPVDCGPPRPSVAVRRYPCPTSVTTPRGRVIHRFDDTPGRPIRYVVLGETLIAFKVTSPRFPEDLTTVVDAFEPVTAEDIARLVDATFRERELVRQHPERYISFTPYVPEETPPGYRQVLAAFDNPRDIQRPYLFMRWRGDDGGFRLDEFALPTSFAPPRSCGPSNPEAVLELPCSLRFTTPDGRRVYTGAALSPAYVPIGDTMVVIDHSFDGDKALGALVDSLRPKPAASIRRFSCPDDSSC